MMNRLDCNRLRFKQSSSAGHYESYFQRANHPTRPLALWIRYTVFSPKGHTSEAEGELWAMWFDGEKQLVKKAYQALPWSQCAAGESSESDSAALHMRIGTARLDDRGLIGSVNGFAWDLSYTSPTKPLLLFPESFYERALPKAKVLVGSPNAFYSGQLTVDGETFQVQDWPGSQNHNWGSKHTDLYAWGQVSGFDDAPDAFLEVATARVKLGGLLTPPLTPLVLRLEGEELRLNTPAHLWRASGSFRDFEWHFEAHDERVHCKGKISAPKSAFAALDYRNPPGGVKVCLNSKLAKCELTVTFANGKKRELHSAHRAAFELLGDRDKLAAMGCAL